ncbi:MAG TPA: hypothetical protein VLF67_03655, partial [Candidatus Saccharimonas sp.]|nr:hypothetical protein [Candidatus Saccharimonas sp.]
MKCQHCGSDNLTVARGQNYCLDCKRVSGQIGRRSIHPMRFSLLVSLAVGLLTGAALAASIWFRFDSDVALYCLAAAGIVVAGSSILGHSALLYGRSRALDGRPAPHALWWAVARSGFMDILNVLLITLIQVAVLVGIGFMAWHASVNHLPGWGQIIVLSIVNLLLVWLSLGAAAALRLGIAAIIIGNMAALPAVRLAWRMFFKAGGQAVALALETAFVRILMVLAVLSGVYMVVFWLTGRSDLQIALGCAALGAYITLVISFVTIDIESRLWLEPYRRWV